MVMTSLIENDRQEIYDFLKSITPFNYLADEVLESLLSEAVTACYKKGSHIFSQGERSKKTLFLILEGRAQALAMMGDEETVTTVRKKGDFFGVTVLLSDEPYPISMIAAEDLTCLLITQNSFHQALSSSTEFADYFTRDLASRLKELYKTISTRQLDNQLLEKSTLRQKIGAISTKNVITCLPMDNVCDVARKMNSTRVSSVVVTAFNNKPIGIITEKDLVTKILCAQKPDLACRAHEIMSSNLITAHPEDFTYKALLLMIKNKIKHIVVTDEHEVLKGIVTVKDLIQSRKSGAFSIVKQIEYRDTFTGLAEAIQEVDQLKQALLNERSYASEICALTTELYDRVTRKIILMAEEELAACNRGMPPVRYSFVNMGSAGRREQFSRTDQDHGIIYEDPPEDMEETSAQFFLELGRLIVRELENCGFRRCKGQVMADNPRWCMPLSSWKNTLNTWVTKLDPDNIRDMTIFLDFRHLYGSEQLSEDLKDYTSGLFQEAKHALLFMADDDLKHRAPLDLFGRFITEKTETKRRVIDLKRAVTVHMVDSIRLFALREGIKETNSFDRLHRLKYLSVFKPDDAEYFEAAFEALLMFRIRNAVEKMKQGEEPDNYISLDSLTRKEKSLLKESMLMVNRLQSLMAHAFHAYKT